MTERSDEWVKPVTTEPDDVAEDRAERLAALAAWTVSGDMDLDWDRLDHIDVEGWGNDESVKPDSTRDFVDEMVDEFTADDPEFSVLLEVASLVTEVARAKRSLEAADELAQYAHDAYGFYGHLNRLARAYHSTRDPEEA